MSSPPRHYAGNFLAALLVFELPTLLFFLMYTSIIHLWYFSSFSSFPSFSLSILVMWLL